MTQVRDKHLGNEVFFYCCTYYSTWPIRTKADKPELIGKRYNSRKHFNLENFFEGVGCDQL